MSRSAVCLMLDSVPVALLSLTLLTSGPALAIDSVNCPRPIPLTRPEMKSYLEDMKQRTPRIPLPELTDEEKEQLGERGGSYESRLRSHYLRSNAQGPGGQRRGEGGGTGNGGAGRNSDPDMTLDYAFKVQLFWIVSRTNNCQYCLGHQESKLLGAGLTEDQIAALDGDWAEHTPAERTAFAFARKITYEPHLLSDADIDGLRKYYTDKQILEMILSVAGNNSINRWKEGAGIPQSSGGGNFGRRPENEQGGRRTANEQGGRKSEGDQAGRRPIAEQGERPGRTDAHSYLTPTSSKFQQSVTKVAPIRIDATTGQATRQGDSNRPALESRQEVERRLSAARTRQPRLPLVDAEDAREVVKDSFPDGPLPQWVRLLANFPGSAPRQISGIISAETNNDLSPLLKAQLSWIIARQDRAWYATGLAKASLEKLGWANDQIYLLDGDWSSFTPAERSLFTLARKLAATPVVLTDHDVAEAIRLTSPRDVVQTISYVTSRASFNRITESAGLRIDD